MALLRASWLSATSYRVNMVLSLGSVVVGAVPIYFMAQALQPVMAPTIESQGDRYFAFIIVGVMTQWMLSAALYALPQALSSSIANGTLEALLSTRASWRSLFTGLTLYSFAWTGVKVAVLLPVGLLLGVTVVWENGLLAIGILLLIAAAHVPISIASAASVLAYRTPGPLPQVAFALSALLGGVYYPTHIIPSWLQDISDVLPMTYGLRALRRVTLEGWPAAAVGGDLAVVAAAAAVLLVLSLLLFRLALRYARRTGTLAQY